MFEIVEPEKKALQEWKIGTGTKRAVKQNKLDIAKKMKKDGVEIDIIKKYTGLSVSAIEKL